MSTDDGVRSPSRNFSSDSLTGRGWAVVALSVAACYYAVVVGLGVYGGLLVGLVVPVSLGVEAYARARHPAWRSLVGARDGNARGADALPTLVGFLAGCVVTALALLAAGV